MKPLIFGLCWLAASLAWAEQPPSTEPDPSLQRLQAMQNMRQRLEQDWAGYLQAARANTANSSQPAPTTSGGDLGQLRREVTDNLERMEERFRCLDVDLNGNNGNVVLICGDNQGGVATNNQQALGADLNVTGGSP